MQLVKFCRVLLALTIVHDLGHQSQLLAHSFGLIDQSLVGLTPPWFVLMSMAAAAVRGDAYQ